MDESNETLKAVLRDMGIDDVDTMDQGDIILLARAMGIEVPGEDADGAAGSDYMDDTAANDEDYGMDEANDDEQADLDTAFMVDQTLADAEANNATATATETTSTTEDVPSAQEDNSHDAIISAFCDITGSDPTSAGHFLEAFGWDLEGAIPMYLENAQNTGMNTSPPVSLPGIRGQRAGVHTHFSEAGSPMQTSEHGFSSGLMPGIGGDDNDVTMPPLPLPAGVGTGAAHQQHLNSVLANMMRSSGMQMDDEGEDFFSGMGGPGGGIASFMAAYQGQMSSGNSSRQGDRYDEDGIRLPDPVQRQRLMPTGRMFRGGGDNDDEDEEEFSMGRAEDPTVEWMFPPPRHLSSQSSLEKARTQAQSESRWLLVNIQSHEQFASHMLNRDTWVHETMESVLRSTFLLWQRGHTSGEGQAYMRMHRLNNDDLPHIGVIDPRTGAKLLTLTGFISPDDLLVRLMDFSDRNLLTAPRVLTSSSRGSVAGSSNAVSANASTAASVASSGNSSSANIEGLAAGADATISAADSPSPSSAAPSDAKPSARDYKWLPRAPGTESSNGSVTDSDAKSEGKSAVGDKSTGTSTPVQQAQSQAAASSSGGQVLGVAEVAASAESAKGLDYGDVPEEPAEGTDGAIKVSIKLSNGKAHARRYLKSTPVRALFAVAAAVDDAARDKSFDLVMRYPPLNLSSCAEKTLDECALAGSQLIIKFA